MSVSNGVRYPRPLLDKLGVKPDARVAVMGVEDAGFVRSLEERTGDISRRARKESDLIFFGVRAARDLDRLAALGEMIRPAGAVWVVRAKGDGAVVKESDVMAAAKRAGLVDIKVVSFSQSHSALKLVIPVAHR